MKLNDLFRSLRTRRREVGGRIPAAPPPAPVPARPDLVFTPFLARSDIAVSFADPSRPDQPLLHVNDAFCALTGYAREDAVGRNCRFLQGRLTRRSEADAIREGIAAERYVFTRLLNYRRDGALFDNVLQVGQLRDTRGEVRYLYGFQWDVTDTLERIDRNEEVDRRDRTLSPRMRALERSARHLERRSVELGRGAAGVPLVERLVAISRPHQLPTPDAPLERDALREVLEFLLAPWGDVAAAALRLEGTRGRFPPAHVGPLALWLHELAGASRAHGALSGSGARAVLSWGFPTERGRPRVAFHWSETAPGATAPASPHGPSDAFREARGNGATLVRELAGLAGGRVSTRTNGSAVESALVLPGAEDEPAGGAAHGSG